MLALEMLGVGEEVRPPSKAKHTLQQRFRNARASKTQPAAGAHVTPSVTYKCALVLSKHIGEGIFRQRHNRHHERQVVA